MKADLARSMVILESGDRLAVLGGEDLRITKTPDGKVVEICATAGDVYLVQVAEGEQPKEVHGNADGGSGSQDRG